MQLQSALKLFALSLALGCVAALAADYDPLLLSGATKSEPLELRFRDARRERDLPLRVYLPASSQPAPIILFSHGLGGSREGAAYLGQHWAARGYVAVHLQHPGSDDAIWKDVPQLQRMGALRRAASVANAADRFKDVSAVLDQLNIWASAENHPLKGRMLMNKIGMSGHSFGAVTTQAVSGQRSAQGEATFTDNRIKAALALSPDSAKNSGAPNVLFGQINIPWMLMTGTEDHAPVGNATVETRLAIFPALPVGGKYELVLFDAAHDAFADRALPGTKVTRNPNHHRAIIALSTAFWDTWLKDDASAKAWLESESVRSVLEPKDRWQRK